MPLLSFPPGITCLPCALRYSRPTRFHHVLKYQLHTASVHRLQAVQSEVSSIPQDVVIRKIKSPKQKQLPESNAPSSALPESTVPSIPSAPPKHSISSQRPSGSLARREASKLLTLYEELHQISEQLRVANDGKDSRFNSVIKEAVGQTTLANLGLLSRCYTLYSDDVSREALGKIKALIQYADSSDESTNSKNDSLSEQQLEHLQFMRFKETRKLTPELARLNMQYNEAYVYLKGIMRQNGDTQASVGKTMKERKQQASMKKAGKLVAAAPVPAELRKKATVSKSKSASDSKSESAQSAPHEQPPPNAHVINTGFIKQVPVRTEEALDVPTLSNDLSRVLFNPGVYQLRDPRSRVYNFDPHLQHIMPVEEFNWDALNPYITSSEDHFLRDVAIQQKKRYIGSSSSMSAAMSQFHFLLSAWRPLDFSSLSKKMNDGLTSFTQITRAPASIFLRYRNGVYAVDSDKEHDVPNILMMHGKSMEKLLTLEKEEFEKYRKPKDGEDTPKVDVKPEQYHYSTVENFLLRSQLDAYDPRLPGTGMFDLKTRAVAGIRMYMGNHESGMNYEIKDRFGLWESYDREYYDMIRAAFLKYSLQVRMGRMDGIFVAYHNIARIFGFQYISINELDQALHGQADPTVGNREFKMTIKLMNELFDRATKACPGRSLRLMFETQEPLKKPTSSSDNSVFMRVFAEVVSEDEIDTIQSAGKEVMEDYEDSMARGIDPREEARAAKLLKLQENGASKATPSTLDSIAADTSFLDSVLGQKIDSVLKPVPQPEPKEKELKAPSKKEPERKVLSWKLKIYNEVNGYIVDRPEKITSDDHWNVHYTIEQETENVSSLYTALKNKRRTMFTFDEDEDARQNWFLKNIIRLNESGKKWRLQQDELDAEQEKVVLYPSSSTSRSN